jgi:phosphoenolpyruvate carboxylase
VQRDHLKSATYARAVTAFGLGMLKATGSRVSRRQSDIGADRSMNLRQIRAIPHNAILQQIGYPVNVVAGAGTAAGDEAESIAELLGRSERGRQLVRLLRAANGWPASRRWRRMANCSIPPIGPAAPIAAPRTRWKARAWRWPNI